VVEVEARRAQALPEEQGGQVVVGQAAQFLQTERWGLLTKAAAVAAVAVVELMARLEDQVL
jgi:hypothetical protein